jgi:CDP-6-deoxy-D-xylo-4-hexulose-3-dehydrase
MTEVKYPLACSSWDEKEKTAAKEVIDSGICTMGVKVKEFEKKFAEKFGTKYAVFSNSGSSANLLAISTLLYRKTNPLKAGDEIITTAVSWSTTYYPLHQCGFKIKIVDIDFDTLNMDIDQVIAAITSKTKAIFAVNLLGNPADYERLIPICKEKNIELIIDNCESMGATYRNQEAGTLGLIGTYSCFFSHHISTIEGGVCVTNDEECYQIMLCLRTHGWGRELPNVNHIHNKDGIPFNDLFRFLLPGYNLRPNEVYAAIGLHQLDKLDSIIENRRNNAITFREEMYRLYREFKFDNNRQIRIQSHFVCSEPSWFGFSLVLEGELSGKRDYVVTRLKELGVESRPIVAGNFAKNPVAKLMNCDVHGSLPIADKIDKDGFFIGNSHHDLTQEIKYFSQCLEKIVNELRSSCMY